jgi:hypothetical protein
MSRDSISISLVSAECEHAIGDTTETKEMLRKAFAAAKNHWMVLEPDPQLKGALNAVLVKMGDGHPDRKRLETEIRMLGQFNAWLAAAQAGLVASPPEIPEGHESIGVMALWGEAA